MYEVTLKYEKIVEDRNALFRFEVSQYFKDCFDFNFPFRPLLAFIVECLRDQGLQAELWLPDYDEFEDFITGTIEVQGTKIAVYFEHSLSCISFSANSHEILTVLITASQDRPFQHPGYGLENGTSWQNQSPGGWEMNRIEKSLVLTAIIFMVLYIPYSFIRMCGSRVMPYEIFPLHLLGMGLNFIALIIIIRDLYKRPFPNPNSKLTWLLLILWTGGIGFLIYTFK